MAAHARSCSFIFAYPSHRLFPVPNAKLGRPNKYINIFISDYLIRDSLKHIVYVACPTLHTICSHFYHPILHDRVSPVRWQASEQLASLDLIFHHHTNTAGYTHTHRIGYDTGITPEHNGFYGTFHYIGQSNRVIAMGKRTVYLLLLLATLTLSSEVRI